MALGQWLASGYPVPTFPRPRAGKGQEKETNSLPCAMRGGGAGASERGKGIACKFARVSHQSD